MQLAVVDGKQRRRQPLVGIVVYVAAPQTDVRRPVLLGRVEFEHVPLCEFFAAQRGRLAHIFLSTVQIFRGSMRSGQHQKALKMCKQRV